MFTIEIQREAEVYIIKKLRLQKGWSQSELAEFSGLSVRTIQRIEKGTKPGLESLKCLAAVFDMDIADFQQEENMDMNNITLEEKRAFQQVKRERGFYTHLITYVIVVGLLFAGNYLFNPVYIWAKWPALGWGIGIFTHGIRTFSPVKLFGDEWEKKQIEKKLGRKL